MIQIFGYNFFKIQCLGHSDQITTEDNLTYAFRPIVSGELDFEFKGSSNCHIALTTNSMESDPMYEIIIGGWGNKNSVIRYSRQKPDKVSMCKCTFLT